MLRIDRLGRIGDDAAWLCRVPRQPKSCSCVRPARSQGKITLPASLELHGSFDPKRGLYAGQHGVLESPSPRTLRWTVNLALSSSCSGRGVRTSATSAQQMCFHPPPPLPALISPGVAGPLRLLQPLMTTRATARHITGTGGQETIRTQHANYCGARIASGASRIACIWCVGLRARESRMGRLRTNPGGDASAAERDAQASPVTCQLFAMSLQMCTE